MHQGMCVRAIAGACQEVKPILYYSLFFILCKDKEERRDKWRNIIFLFYLDDQCRCGVERPDTKRNSFNRIIGGYPVDKVSKIISQQYTLCEAQGKDIRGNWFTKQKL